MAAFQRMFCDFSAFQIVGGLLPSATPEALAPRNEGQFWACVGAVDKRRKRKRIIRCFTAAEINTIPKNLTKCNASFELIRGPLHPRIFRLTFKPGQVLRFAQSPAVRALA